MSDRKNRDRAPAAAMGSWMFAWGSAAFLVALILVALSIPSQGGADIELPASAEYQWGKAIYGGEGCGECHSRMVRDTDRGLGAPATYEFYAGSGIYPGSSRIGPDLQNIDSRYPSSLLQIRLTEPDTLQPGTVMPSYSYLSAPQRNALIIYLESSPVITGGWDAIRSRNDIESAVPNEILQSLSQFFDFETGLFIPPNIDLPVVAITGNGIYNSRCAACHGIEGKGDGPVSWREWDSGEISVRGPSPLVPPADLTTREIGEYSTVMLYWRIAEGVPGTQMPAWKGTLSEDGIWFLIGYIRSLSSYSENQSEVVVEPEWIDSTGQFDELEFMYFDEDLQEQGYGTAPGVSQEQIEPADSASEEEGMSTGEGYASDDVQESAEDENAGEESP
jgi:cytochrome c oxidase cbb3-type subunit 2